MLLTQEMILLFLLNTSGNTVHFLGISEAKNKAAYCRLAFNTFLAHRVYLLHIYQIRPASV